MMLKATVDNPLHIGNIQIIVMTIPSNRMQVKFSLLIDYIIKLDLISNDADRICWRRENHILTKSVESNI